MPARQTWKSKVRGVLKFFNSSLVQVAPNNEELEITTSAIYSDDSDKCDSDTEVKIKKRPLSIKSTKSSKSANNSSDKSTINTSTTSKSLQECNECGKTREINWCRNCESKEFVKHFVDWTSNNDLLDKFIKNTQYKAYNYRYYWEWIPYEKLSNIQFLSNGNQKKVFTAIWSDGPRNQWDNENMTFVRRKRCKVILKRLVYSPDNISPEFINELRKHYGHQDTRCSRAVQIYGITLEPKSNHYMLVSAYHNRFDIRSLLKNDLEFSWSDRLRILYNCAEALFNIHTRGHIHKNLHPGNILLHSKRKSIFLNISDLGIYNNRNTNEIFGVIPYVAPEVLNAWPYTQDSDIYSFSMLMYELVTGKPPFFDRAHDQHLIFDICEGLRPEFDINEIPECYIKLMKQCWNTEPVNRPCASDILFIINNWNTDDFPDKQFKREDFELHPEAVYNSRLLGDFISRELELQDQFWEELSENEELLDVQEDDVHEGEIYSQGEESESEQEYENNDRKMSNSNSDSDNENDSSNLDERVNESESNKFQLNLDLNFGKSLTDEIEDSPISNENDEKNYDSDSEDESDENDKDDVNDKNGDKNDDENNDENDDENNDENDDDESNDDGDGDLADSNTDSSNTSDFELEMKKEEI